MSIYIISDHAGFELKKELLSKLKNLRLVDLNPKIEIGDDYPVRAKELVNKMQEGDFGIAICGTGQGICMALNRYKNIRAAALNDIKSTKLVRAHNHANIICLSGRQISLEKAMRLVKIFIESPEDQDIRHLRRIGEMDF